MLKKIIFVITLSEWGGAQRYVFDIAANLSENQFDVSVAVGKGGSGELVAKLSQKGIKSIKIENLVRDIKPISDIKALFELFRIFKKEQPDIVHLNSSKAGIVGSIAAYFAGVPRTIYTVHGWVFNEPLPPFKKQLYLYAEKMTASFKSKIICVSEYDRRAALEVGIGNVHKLITIHNGVEIDPQTFYTKGKAREIFSRRASINFSEDTLIVGTIANLYKTKGLEYLIKASQALPSHMFVIIGEGPERSKLEKIIKENNITNVCLTGAVDEAFRYLKAFDVFVLPSVKEGYPYTILEAVAAEIPIIATNVGGIPEMLPQECLIPPSNADALTNKLRTFSGLPKIRMADTTFVQMIKETMVAYRA